MQFRERIRVSLGAVRASADNRRLRRVQAARLASVTGRWAYTITLAVFAYRSSGAGGVALAGIVRLAPAALASPFVGALTRRTRIDVLLFRGGVVRTAALAGAALAIHVGATDAFVYALVAVEATASAILRPAQNAILPALSETPAELTSTNLALSVIESVGVLLGPLLGAALLQGTSAAVVFLAGAGAYGVSALLLRPIRVEALARGDARSPSFVEDALAGARAVAADRDAAIVVFLYGAQNLVAGALNVLIVVAALRLLDLGQSGVGTLTAAVGVGGVVGGAVVFARLARGRHGSDLALGLLLWGIPLLVLAVVSSRAAAFVLLGVVGVGVTVVDVAAVTLLQRTAPEDQLGHALGLLETVFVVTVALGTLAAPALVAALGVRGALVATGALLPLLALALWRRLHRLDERAPAGTALHLLTGVPIFAPLARPAVEHLAMRARPVTTPAGSVVFAQGDHGDGFYVIEAGDVDVSIDGSHVRTLGPGDYFGEIALLRDVPRTATIRARTDARLLRLEREPFLATVTGNAASSDAARAVVGARLGVRTGLTPL